MANETKDQKSETKPGQKVKMIPNNFPIEELYIDGMAGFIGRGGVFKIDCYRVEGFDPKDQAEVRKVTHRLVMPPSAMNEMAQILQNISQANKKNLNK